MEAIYLAGSLGWAVFAGTAAFGDHDGIPHELDGMLAARVVVEALCWPAALLYYMTWE